MPEQTQTQPIDQNAMMQMFQQMMGGQMPAPMQMGTVVVRPKSILVKVHAQTQTGDANAFVEFETPEGFQPMMIPMVLNQLQMSGWPIQTYDSFRKRRASNGYGGYGQGGYRQY